MVKAKQQSYHKATTPGILVTWSLSWAEAQSDGPRCPRSIMSSPSTPCSDPLPLHLGIWLLDYAGQGTMTPQTMWATAFYVRGKNDALVHLDLGIFRGVWLCRIRFSLGILNKNCKGKKQNVTLLSTRYCVLIHYNSHYIYGTHFVDATWA